GASGNYELLAEHLLVDRLQPAAAVCDLPEDPQYAVLGMIDDLNDASTVPNPVLFLRLVDTEQHAVADTGCFARTQLAWNMDADFGWGAVRFLVPFVGRGDKITIAVARRHIGQNSRGQGARMMQFLPTLFDRSFIG